MSHLSSKGNKHFLDATSSMWPLASFFSVSFWPRHQSFSGNTPFRFSAMPKHVFLLCRPGGLKKNLHELYQKFSTRNAACGLWKCLYFYLTTTTLHVDQAEASNSRLCDQSAPSVCFVFMLEWVDEKEKNRKRIRIRAAVSNVTVVFERKQNIGISIWSWDPIGS